MSYEIAQMQALRGRMLSWVSWMQRACHATSITITPVSAEGFRVHVRWEKPVAGEYTHTFTPTVIFGDTQALAPKARTVQKCAGDFSRSVVQGVLLSRGVL